MEVRQGHHCLQPKTPVIENTEPRGSNIVLAWVFPLRGWTFMVGEAHTISDIWNDSNAGFKCGDICEQITNSSTGD